MSLLECRRCEGIYAPNEPGEGPSDYCPQCRYEYVHQYDDDDDPDPRGRREMSESCARADWASVDTCTASCYAMPTCTVCGLRKKPRGRFAPVEMALCNHECPGYRQEPTAGHMWPDEIPR